MQKPRSKPASSARSYALWLLARKPYASSALAERLERRGYSREESGDAVSYLLAIGYLNDQTYAEDFVQARAETGHGPRQIGWELHNRGVSQEDAEQALGNLDLAKQKEQARSVVSRRLQRADPADPKLRLRLLRFLLQRGYDYALAEEVLSEILASLDSRDENS